ncbi:hypothetical protein K449DRAFT_470087 [Hypoxylon sp. EC38]|nr:hypothetical protein K449DRAFT_470087 [Hypoxylon sp. EC38]
MPCGLSSPPSIGSQLMENADDFRQISLDLRIKCRKLHASYISWDSYVDLERIENPLINTRSTYRTLRIATVRVEKQVVEMFAYGGDTYYVGVTENGCGIFASCSKRVSEKLNAFKHFQKMQNFKCNARRVLETKDQSYGKFRLCPAKQFDRLGATNPRCPGSSARAQTRQMRVSLVFRTRGLDDQAMINGTECTHGRRFHNGACPPQLQISSSNRP